MSTSPHLLQKHLKDLMIFRIHLALNERGKKNHLCANDHYTQHQQISLSIAPFLRRDPRAHILPDSWVEHHISNTQILKISQDSI